MSRFMLEEANTASLGDTASQRYPESAETLASGKLVLLKTKEEKEVILTLADRNLLTIHVGRKKRYQLTDRKTIKDVVR